MKEINVLFSLSHLTIRLVYVQHELSPKNLFFYLIWWFLFHEKKKKKKRKKDLHLESPLQDFIYIRFFKIGQWRMKLG